MWSLIAFGTFSAALPNVRKGSRADRNGWDLSYGIYILAFPVQQAFAAIGLAREWPFWLYALVSAGGRCSTDGGGAALGGAFGHPGKSSLAAPSIPNQPWRLDADPHIFCRHRARTITLNSNKQTPPPTRRPWGRLCALARGSLLLSCAANSGAANSPCWTLPSFCDRARSSTV